MISDNGNSYQRLDQVSMNNFRLKYVKNGKVLIKTTELNTIQLSWGWYERVWKTVVIYEGKDRWVHPTLPLLQRVGLGESVAKPVRMQMLLCQRLRYCIYNTKNWINRNKCYAENFCRSGHGGVWTPTNPLVNTPLTYVIILTRKTSTTRVEPWVNECWKPYLQVVIWPFEWRFRGWATPTEQKNY